MTKHAWSQGTIEAALRLGVEIASYERAAESFSALTHVPLSKSSLQRLVNEYGGQLVAAQTVEAQAMVTVPKTSEEVVWRKRIEPDSPVMAVSVDGVFINVREEGWKEVKVSTISAVRATADEITGEQTVTLTQHSYRAGLWEVGAFTPQHWAEVCRRGVDRARTVVCVNDGAVWIWLLAFICFPVRTEILDWWHATQRLWALANGVLTGSEASAWVEMRKADFRASRLRQVFRQIRLLYPHHQPLPDEVRTALNYFFHNRHRMDYATYRAAGYPIGSGTVESACKTVVQARMKQAGMRWSRNGAQAMLALRCHLLSNRWRELHILAPPA